MDKVDLVEEALKKIVPSEEERTAIKAKVVSFTVDGEPAEALAGRLLKAGLRCFNSVMLGSLFVRNAGVGRLSERAWTSMCLALGAENPGGVASE